jgi:hypothetical protein
MLLQAPGLQPLLDTLQRSRYAREGAAWDASALLAALEEIRAGLKAGGDRRDPLPPLYPARR